MFVHCVLTAIAITMEDPRNDADYITALPRPLICQRGAISNTLSPWLEEGASWVIESAADTKDS